MSVKEKLRILKQNYSIPVEHETLGKELQHMCNLSELIEEKGKVAGEARFINLTRTLMDAQRSEDLTKAMDDTQYLERLYQEFGL